MGIEANTTVRQLSEAFLKPYSDDIHLAIEQKNALVIATHIHTGLFEFDTPLKNGESLFQNIISKNDDAFTMGVIRLIDTQKTETLSLFSYDTNTKTPLHYAASMGKVSLAALILKKGCDIEAPDLFGRTALYDAIDSQKLAMTELFLKKGASTDKIGKKNMSAVYLAVFRKTLTVLKLLLKYKANPSILRTDGKYGLAICLALSESFVDGFDALTEANINVNQIDRNHYNYSALLVASRFNNPKAMKKLIEHKADVTHTDRHGAGALHYLLTSTKNKKALGSSVALLLKHGVSLQKTRSEVRHLVGTTIPKGMTPLSLAAYRDLFSLIPVIQKKQCVRPQRDNSEESLPATQVLSQSLSGSYGLL